MSLNSHPAHHYGAEAAQILMPKKRQHGFDLGVGQAATQPAGSVLATGTSDSKPISIASSFIDTDILLSDDLWNQLAGGSADLSGFHHGGDSHDQPRYACSHSHSGTVMTSSDVSMADGRLQRPHQHQHAAMADSFINIPQTQTADFFGVHGGSFHSFISRSSQHDDHSLFERSGAGSMEEEDSPDGFNGDAASTVATSVISPSSHGTMASSLSKSLQTRHRRSGSNASLQTKGRTGRSSSRPNLKTIPQERTRNPERSPSQDRGGVGKAPTSRSRPSRRASIGPAAQAAVQASVHGHLRIDAQGAAVSVGASGKPEPRSPTLNLSSSTQSGQQRWSMLGGSGGGGGDVHDPMSLQNLTLGEQRHPYAWNLAMSQAQPPGVVHSASASLRTPLSFQTSMQQLQLQTPPVPTSGFQSQPSMDEAIRETSTEPYNPFMFPPYAQGQESASHKAHSEVSVPSLRAGSEASQDPAFVDTRSLEGSSSPTRRSPSQPAEAELTNSKKAATKASKASRAAKERKMSKSAPQAPAKKALQGMHEEADGNVACGHDDDDEDALDDDDDEQPLANMSKSEAEAKRLAEKRRRRRESHNAVERRRRDNINEKITELATLLPEAMLLDAIATSTQGGNSGTFAPALAAKAAVAKGDTPPGGLHPDGSDADLTKCSTAAYAAALAPVHANSAALAAAQAKPNKGIILRKSVEYIRHLQQFLDMQMSRIGFLEAELQRHREVMQCSGMQMPSMPTQSVQDLFGLSSTFGGGGSGCGDASGGFLGSAALSHEINTRSLMDLSMPAPPDCQQDHRGQAGPSAPSHRHDGQEEVTATSLVDWLEGFDQRTGLPRRSSVDPIEEDEHENLERAEHELSRQRGRRGQPPSSRPDDDHEEERGRSRQRGNASSHSQHGSWPALEMMGARSPLQLLHDGKDDLIHREYTHLGDFKMEA